MLTTLPVSLLNPGAPITFISVFPWCVLLTTPHCVGSNQVCQDFDHLWTARGRGVLTQSLRQAPIPPNTPKEVPGWFPIRGKCDPLYFSALKCPPALDSARCPKFDVSATETTGWTPTGHTCLCLGFITSNCRTELIILVAGTLLTTSTAWGFTF